LLLEITLPVLFYSTQTLAISDSDSTRILSLQHVATVYSLLSMHKLINCVQFCT